MEIVISGILVGIALSLIFIGPVFFLLLETSINKGWKQAVALDLGVILCDLLFIFTFYFAMKDVNAFISKNPLLESYMYRVGGLVMLIYGLILVFKKESYKSMRKMKLKQFSTSYFVTFTNGFLLNLLNVGVIFFWFGLVSYLSVEYTTTRTFMLFIGIAFGTFLALDLVKIFLARKVEKALNFRTTIMLRRIMGVVLIMFSAILFSKGFGAFSKIDQKTEKMLQEQIKTK